MVFKNIYGILSLLTKKESFRLWFLDIVFLPGTFLHEVSHFLVSLLLLVPVYKLKLIPNYNKYEGEICLGGTLIAKVGPLRRSLIGLAPFVFGILSLFLIFYVFWPRLIINVWWKSILVAILIFEIANCMFVSKKDLKDLWIILLFVIIVILILELLGVEVFVLVSEFINKQLVKQILRQMFLVLLIPSLINILVLLVLQYIRSGNQSL